MPAFAEMASLQIEHEQRIATAENRLDRAAAFVGELGQRVRDLEQRTAPGQPMAKSKRPKSASRSRRWRCC